MNENITRWGIIGCGRIANKFAGDLKFVSDGRLNAVASRDLSKSQAFAQHHDCPNAFGSYQEMLESGLIDVVYIAVPHTFHCELAIMCLEAGIPVLCEKAFAVNASQVERMIQTSRNKEVFLMEAIWTRFIPAINKIMELIDAREIGDIKHITADFGFLSEFDPNSRLYNPDLTGGSLMDIGIYPLFISKLLLGNPDAIKAVGVLAPTGVDVNCSVVMSYPDGANATLYSTLSAKTDTSCTIFGTKGKIYIPGRFIEAKEFTLQLDGQEPETIACERKGLGYCYEAEEVQRCMAEGRIESNHLPLQFSQELMEQMDEIRRQIGVVYPIEKDIE